MDVPDFLEICTKTNLTFQLSDRTFKIWEYQVSHGQLLIRSPKAPATQTSPEFVTNVDLVCTDVEYLAVPGIIKGIEILPATTEEIRHLGGLVGKAVNSENIKVLVSGGKRFPIIASSFSFSENDWDIFESPFEFRSRFRSKS
jgi:hypothetical protein